MKHATTILAIAAALLASAAQADSAQITDTTQCGEFVAAADSFERAPSASSREKLREFYLAMGNTMDGLDIEHVRAGGPGIRASLSDGGRVNLFAAAAVQCRDPSLTV